MRTALVLILALVLTGCVGREAAPTAQLDKGTVQPSVIVDPAAIIAGGDVSGAAPVWAVGDAWQIAANNGQGDTETAALVVTRASSDAYTLRTTSESLSAYDAMYDISYLGEIRARDLAGAQNGQPIQFFDFPLTDGKTWTTVWDGLDVALTATQNARGFDIVGTVEGDEYVVYDFLPDLKWWSKLEFAEGYGFTVQRFSSGWTGELAHATANVVFEGASETPVLNRGTGSFTIAEDQTFVHVSIRGGGDAWGRAFELIQPDGMPYIDWMSGNFEVSDAAASEGGYSYQERIPALPGEWRIVSPTLHDQTGWGSVKVHEIKIDRLAFA